MSLTTLSIDDDFLNAQALAVHAEFHDSEHIETPFLNEQDRVLGKGKPAQKGGARWISKIPLGAHSETVEMPTGFERSNLNISGIEKSAVFRPFKARRAIVIAAEEADMSSADSVELAELAKRRMMMTLPSVRRELEEHIWKNNKFSNYGTINGSDSTTGFIEARALGAQTNSLGGLSKTTYQSTPGVQNLFYDCAGSFNSAGLRGMWTLQTRARMYGGSPKNRVWFASEQGLINYRNAIGANERFMDASKGLDAGYMELTIGGSPVIPNLYMPNDGAATGVADAEWTFAYLDFQGVQFKWSVSGVCDGYFGRTKWEPVGGDYDVRVMHVELRGQLMFLGGLNASALMIGGDSW